MVDPLRLKDPDTVIRAIEMFIFEHANYHQGVVLDLVDDVDSVLLLTLASRALGANRIQALTFTSGRIEQYLEDAVVWARKLGVDPTRISLDIPRQLERSGAAPSVESRIAQGNFITRLKMAWRYALANSEHRLVLGDMNRSRWLLGHFAKHGDGAADLFPLGNLFRTQTLQLAKHLQLPVSIIGRPPSAGFWEGQTDEKELGAGYDTLDRILYHVIDRKHSPQETAERLGTSERLVYDLIARLEANEHKRLSPLMTDLEEF